MISFIFSSRSKYYAYILITMLLTGAMLIAFRKLPTSFKPIENLSALVTSENYYLQYNDVSIDDYVLFHGFQGTKEYLKTADILLLGSSRLGYAIQEEVIKNNPIVPYVLAFGHEEMDLFPMKIIDKFDLRPKLFIINVDEFFENRMSKFAEKVAKEGPFPAIRSIIEYNSSTLLQNEIHQYIPYFSPVFTKREEAILVRSRKNGTWNFLKEPINEQSVPLPPDNLPTSKQIEYARSVVNKLKAKGSKIIFILIPNPNTPIIWASKLANDLNIPFWPYSFESVLFRDGSHMTSKEGKTYSRFLMTKINDYIKSNEWK